MMVECITLCIVFHMVGLTLYSFQCIFLKSGKTSASIMPVKVQPFQDLAKVPSHCHRHSSRFSSWLSYFSFSLVWWARDEANHHPTKSLKSRLRLTQGKQNLRATCPKGKLKFNLFQPCHDWIAFRACLKMLMLAITVRCMHMMSWQSCWCSKTMKWRPC